MKRLITGIVGIVVLFAVQPVMSAPVTTENTGVMVTVGVEGFHLNYRTQEMSSGKFAELAHSPWMTVKNVQKESDLRYFITVENKNGDVTAFELRFKRPVEFIRFLKMDESSWISILGSGYLEFHVSDIGKY